MPHVPAELNRARLRKRTQLTDTSLTTANYPFPLTDNQQKRYDAIITLVAALFVLIPFTFFPANCVAFIVKVLFLCGWIVDWMLFTGSKYALDGVHSK